MRVLPYGDQALLVEFDDGTGVRAFYDAFTESRPQGVVGVVPAARTVLVRFDPTVTSPTVLMAALRSVRSRRAGEANGPLVEVPVVYDGEDLVEVATATGLTTREVVERHLAPEYRVDFCGFVPGFAYLSGLDPVLHLPRRSSPRVRVPMGAVAVADRYTAVYPRSSPGGWNLLGHTHIQMFDVNSSRPAVLAPGTRVRFCELVP